MDIISGIGIVGEHLLAGAHLFAVIHAEGDSRSLPRFRQRRQQQRRKNGDDGNHNEQLNQRESCGWRPVLFHILQSGSERRAVAMSRFRGFEKHFHTTPFRSQQFSL